MMTTKILWTAGAVLALCCLAVGVHADPRGNTGKGQLIVGRNVRVSGESVAVVQDATPATSGERMLYIPAPTDDPAEPVAQSWRLYRRQDPRAFSHEELQEEKLPDGSVRVRLGDRFMSYLMIESATPSTAQPLPGKEVRR